jgi:hypothetical protein
VGIVIHKENTRDALNQIYQEIKYDIWHFVSLYRSVKSSGMGVQHVVKLLTVANNHLPAVEYKYEVLQKQIGVLEYDKRSAVRDFQDLTNQIVSMGDRLDLIKLDCEKEIARLRHLQQERMKQEALVKQFKNNNEEYVKIRKTVEEKLHSVLVDRKELLGRAVLCVIESMRKDPDKYDPLYFNDDNDNISPSATASASSIAAYYNRQYYSSSYIDSQAEGIKSRPASFKRESILDWPSWKRLLSSAVSKTSGGTTVGFPYLSRATMVTNAVPLCTLVPSSRSSASTITSTSMEERRI